MIELELSLLGTADIPWLPEIQKLVQKFSVQSHASVTVTSRDWETAWVEMVRSSLYGKSPAVSEIGTTWVADLIGMNTLSPLPASLVRELGGADTFLPQNWESCFVAGDPNMWAVPWVSGARVLYYRRDLLRKARVDPDTAFSTPGAMLETLAQLQQAGVAIPWVTPTAISVNTIHQVTTWVWAAGGDFIADNGRHLLFADDNAIEGMANYFSLGRFMGPNPEDRSFNAASNLFWRGNAAVTMDGTWVYQGQKASASPQVLENLGVALVPGPSFLGGSNLVVWSSALNKLAAVELLKFMIEPEALMTMLHFTGLVPARRDLFHSPEVVGREFGVLFNQAVEIGRSWPTRPFSGMIEDKLHYAFGRIWGDVLASPKRDPREIISSYLVPLKIRLEMAINS